MDNNKRILDILERYNAGDCSDEEGLLVDIWYKSLDQGAHELDEELLLNRLQVLDRRFKKITLTHKKSHTVLQLYRILGGVAGMIAVVGVLIYLAWTPKQQLADLDLQKQPGDGTQIVLEDSSIINVDKLSTLDTINTRYYRIVKHSSGELEYLASDDAPSLIYNTVKTGAGDIVNLRLSDGTKVWLNANSSITYPIVFEKNYRDLTLDGEGYFEVSHRSDTDHPQPFHVKTKNHTIAVMGTRFVVDTYLGRFQASLLEGKIALKEQAALLGEKTILSNPILLEPNQRFVDGQIAAITDPMAELDWKNGFFNLTDRPFQEVLDELTNWYGVTFVLAEDITTPVLYGQLSRKKKLSEVLQFIGEVNDLSFLAERGKIYVRRK